MPKTKDQVKPNYAPVYAAAMYPELARIFVDNGYALAVHGSLARDFDIIGIPWAEEVSEPRKVLNQIKKKFAVRVIGRVTKKRWGRICYTLSVGWGDCSIDLSFLPVKK